jgi:hypothetical protein
VGGEAVESPGGRALGEALELVPALTLAGDEPGRRPGRAERERAAAPFLLPGV